MNQTRPFTERAWGVSSDRPPSSPHASFSLPPLSPVLQMSFSSMFIVDLVDTDAEIKALKAARDVMQRSPLEPRLFASSSIFLFVEQVRCSCG